jgi:hypothetical protein
MFCIKFECNLFFKDAVEGTGLHFVYNILNIVLRKLTICLFILRYFMENYRYSF